MVELNACSICGALLRPRAIRIIEFLPYSEALRAVQRDERKGESRPVEAQVEAIGSVDGSMQQCRDSSCRAGRGDDELTLI
jgi:hypothetical protein